ncbi:HNH endonuclease family protein [Sinomonas sp. R1AF57]|uniref:HNH endonuclease family protein n=1 Tax=Sinomonas sp. R1AF57 TaxID=2020377 RepID=UPI000B604FAC|nr:HNH endonuclease family protein [Sinomonas sp. R1AF57]ASN51433.1 calcium-binding protein [Sinomonas sp. R1AF57]
MPPVTRPRPSARTRAVAFSAWLATSLAIVAGLGAAAPSPAQAADSTTATVYAAPNPQPAYGTEAAVLLETIPVKGRAPKTGYTRDEFGPAWLDVDRNGCDTRNDMLNRDLTDITYVNSVPCKVASGTLADPYTATAIAFLRGTTTSDDVQIDHVVALSDAWQKGAQQLTYEQRVALANDPLNLQSTDGPTNQQKGDGDAATWLPPNKGFRCDYVARQVSVKATYSLWVTQAEHDAMSAILAGCPGQLAPTNQPAQAAAQGSAPAPTSTLPLVTPGAYCSTEGAQGVSSIGLLYTCKSSATDSRLRWRQ